jgi:Hint domain
MACRPPGRHLQSNPGLQSCQHRLARAHYKQTLTAATDTATGLEKVTFALCFCRGTLIRTPDGEVPVEYLAIGDPVVTWGGQTRHITWIGLGRVLATRGRRNAATPVIVRKGALGQNVPHRDLHVTKGHSLFLDGALIPVEFLVNHRSILWDDRAHEVSIYHIELATHDVLVANGAPAESYRDDGNRWLFQNANSGWGLAPQSPCAPVLTGGELVDAAWRRLLEQAGPRPGVPLTGDPGLHLLVDRKRLDATELCQDTYTFHLNTPPGSVRLVSRASAPQELGIARDPRVLGVAVRQIVLAQTGQLRTMEADDVCLADGYHGFESDWGIRWTNGDATVPGELFVGTTSASTLSVFLGGSTLYADFGDMRREA